MKKKNVIILLVILVLIVVLGIFVPKLTDRTYAVDNLTLVETVKNENPNKISTYSAGASGVFYTNDHEYRYIGAEVDNYVLFNNDLYRIIGVFDENSHGVPGKELVKLIRSRILGSFSWGIYNSSATSGSYLGYKNDWAGTTAGVAANTNVLLNHFFYNDITFLTSYGNCATWTYFGSNVNYRTNDCSDIVGYGIDASVRDYIEEVTWYLKGYKDTNYNKNDFYICERSENTEITDCTSGYSNGYSKSSTGYIGLLYASDYLYASGNYVSTNTTNAGTGLHGNKNWLYKGYEWTITPDGDSDEHAFAVNSNGYLSSNTAGNGFGIRPTFYLKSSVYVTGGDGSFDNPYTIACDDCSE